MATLRERRKVDRERQKRWRERRLAEGNKQLLVMLDLNAQIALKRVKRRTGETNAEIINRATTCSSIYLN